MIATFVNAVAVIIGGLIGLFAKSKINESYTKAIYTVIGLATLYIGIDGLKPNQDILIIVISLIVGCVIGEFLNLDDKISNLGNFIESKFHFDNKSQNIAKGFISSCLLFCIGSMTIIGSIESGLTGNHQIIFTKSLLDFVAAIIYSASLGIGVLFSSIFIVLYQGGLTICATLVAPLFTTAVIEQISTIGSILIIALSLDLLEIKKIKLVNLLPAIFLPILFDILLRLFV